MNITYSKTYYKQFLKIKDKNEHLWRAALNATLKIANSYQGGGLNKEKINDYWSYRVNDDLRIISYITNDYNHLVYVGNHDDAYRFCKETTPHTIGSKVEVEYWEKKEDIKVTRKSGEFDFLSQYGFDEFLIRSLNECKNESELESKIRLFSPEYRELIISRGQNLQNRQFYSSDVLLLENDRELENALKSSLPEWCLFLHPSQNEIKEFPINKNLVIKGGPGTGKSISLIWRYIHLYKLNPNKKPLFLCRSKTTAVVLFDLIKQIDPQINPVIETFPNVFTNKELKNISQYSHILIDEGQDLFEFSLNQFFEYYKKHSNLDSKSLPNFTIATDFNQNIISKLFKKHYDKYKEIYHSIVLTYCYRSTREIIEFATKKLQSINDPQTAVGDYETTSIYCPLVGNDVQELEFEDDSSLEGTLKNLIEEKFGKSNTEWCVIFTGLFNPTKLEEMKNLYPNKILNAEESKGKEYFSGIVVHYQSNKHEVKTNEIKKLIFENYVALTRFRDGCVLIKINTVDNSQSNILRGRMFYKFDRDGEIIRCYSCGNIIQGKPAFTKPIYTTEHGKSYKNYCLDCFRKIKKRLY